MNQETFSSRFKEPKKSLTSCMAMCIVPKRVMFPPRKITVLLSVVLAKCSASTKEKMRRKKQKVPVRQNLHGDSEVKDDGCLLWPVKKCFW